MILPSTGCTTTAKAISSWEPLTSVVTTPCVPKPVSGAPVALYLASVTASGAPLVVVLSPQAVRATDKRRTGRANPVHDEIFTSICAPFAATSLVQSGCLRALQFVTGRPRTTERRHEHTHQNGADLRLRRHGARRREDLPRGKARGAAGEDERGRAAAEGSAGPCHRVRARGRSRQAGRLRRNRG